jgi:hypothetical protein
VVPGDEPAACVEMNDCLLVIFLEGQGGEVYVAAGKDYAEF